MIREDFRLEANTDGWFIYQGNEIVVSCNRGNDHVGLKREDKEVIFSVIDTQTTSQGAIVTYEGNGWQMQDELQLLDTGFYEVTRKWVNHTGESQDVVLKLDMSTHYTPTYYMIPSVNYNGNQWGKGKEPKGLTCEGKPWVFAYNRSSLPSATFSENEAVAFGLFSSIDEESRSSASSLLEWDQGFIHRIIWPETEAPYRYASRDRYEDAVYNAIRIEDEKSYEVKAYFSVDKVEHKNFGWVKAYDKTWDRYKAMEDMLHQPEKVWELGIRYTNALLEEDGETLLPNIGYTPEEGGQWRIREKGKFEIGWCGQHGSLGTALIKDYLMNGNKDSLEKGVKILDSWVDKGAHSTGLFTVNYDKSVHEEANTIADTCNLGWGAWYLLEGYLLAKEAGIHRLSWFEMAMGVCDFFVSHYNEAYIFGKTWDVATGEVVDDGGSIGAFMLIPLIRVYELTKETKYLEIATKAYRAYARRDLDQMQCTAGALDTCCVDKETCWPFLKTGLDLYEVTGEDYYLEEAKKAGYYILSWMMHYETVDPSEDNDFVKYGYKTFGGTAVSAQHHHLDPWGGLIAYDWVRLGTITGNEKWIERARATWQNALYCIANGEEQVHGLVRPIGSQNEAYFHCNWSFHMDMEEADRMNDWLVAWPSAFRLVTLMRTEDWDIWR